MKGGLSSDYYHCCTELILLYHLDYVMLPLDALESYSKGHRVLMAEYVVVMCSIGIQLN